MHGTNLDTVKPLKTPMPSEVHIVAVTKTFPFETVQKAVDMGYTHIGENRVEEAAGKIELARQNNLKNLCWHMIGHVQSRKVKEVVRLFDRIDSVDSLELLEKLNTEAGKCRKILHVLLEVNMSGELRKYGFFTLTASEIQGVKASNIVIDGLMTMAPYTKNPEDNRELFRKMKLKSQSLQAEIPDFGSAISMGTSCDYIVAIEEGATEVRLGEALFGKRTI